MTHKIQKRKNIDKLKRTNKCMVLIWHKLNFFKIIKYFYQKYL